MRLRKRPTTSDRPFFESYHLLISLLDAAILRLIKEAAAREKARKAEAERRALLDPKARKAKQPAQLLGPASTGRAADDARKAEKEETENRAAAVRTISWILVSKISNIGQLIVLLEAAGIHSLAENLKERLEQPA